MRKNVWVGWKATTFAERLAAARHAADITRAVLAERSGLSVSFIGAAERGDMNNPTRESLGVLAHALGCAVGWLTAGEGDGPAAAAEWLTARRATEARS